MSFFTKPDDQQQQPAEQAPSTTVEAWAKRKGTPDWAFTAAKWQHGWGQGRELSEAEYDAAVAAAMQTKIEA